MTRLRLMALAAAACCMQHSLAQLHPGAPAPALEVEAWVAGGSADLVSGAAKNVHLVAFWSVSAPASLQGFSYLNDFRERYPDLVVVAITDESAFVVKPLVDRLRDRIRFVVACDQDGATTRAYFGAQGSIKPVEAFIVDHAGKIAWQDRFDEQRLERALELVLAGKLDADALKNLERSKSYDNERRSRLEEAWRKYYELARSDQPSKAAPLGQELLRLAADEPRALNEFAWLILTDEKIELRDLDLALSMAKAAVEGTRQLDAAALDTYALALAQVGKPAEAVQHQKRAVELCFDGEIARRLQQALQKYEQAAGVSEAKPSTTTDASRSAPAPRP
jgi:hypothetical protein